MHLFFAHSRENRDNVFGEINVNNSFTELFTDMHLKRTQFSDKQKCCEEKPVDVLS